MMIITISRWSVLGHATKAVGGDGHNAQTRTRGEVYAPRACAWNHSKGAINELNRGEFII